MRLASLCPDYPTVPSLGGGSSFSRRQELLASHGFLCACERCVAPAGSRLHTLECEALALVCPSCSKSTARERGGQERGGQEVEGEEAGVQREGVRHLLLPRSPYDEGSDFECSNRGCSHCTTAGEAARRVRGVVESFTALSAPAQASGATANAGGAAERCRAAVVAERAAQDVLGPSHHQWTTWIEMASTVADAADDTPLLLRAYSRKEAMLVSGRAVEDEDLITRVNHALLAGVSTEEGRDVICSAFDIDATRAFSAAGVDGFIARWIPTDYAGLVEELWPILCRHVEGKRPHHQAAAGGAVRNGASGGEALDITPGATPGVPLAAPHALARSSSGSGGSGSSSSAGGSKGSGGAASANCTDEPSLQLHLDPCLLPDSDDALRWRVVRECEGYMGPTSRNAHPAEMMCFELCERARFETDGTPPDGLAALRRMILLMVMATEAGLQAHLEGVKRLPLLVWEEPKEGSMSTGVGACPKAGVTAPICASGGAASGAAAAAAAPAAAVAAAAAAATAATAERAQLELQAVGKVLLMVVDLNVALVGTYERTLPHSTAGSEKRRAQRAEMLEWRRALREAHDVDEEVSLDSLLDALSIDDGDVAGELRLPIPSLMAAAMQSAREQSVRLLPAEAIGWQPQAQPSSHPSLLSSPSARDRFNALIVRQLLSKYELDDKAGLAAIQAWLAPNGASAAAASMAATASPFAAAVSGFMQRFCIGSAEDAAALLLYFSGGAAAGPAEASGPAGPSAVTSLDLSTALLRLPDAAVEATPVVALVGLLSAGEIRQIFSSSEALAQAPMPPKGTLKIGAYPHHVRYGGSHVALFLHRGEHFARHCPLLLSKLVNAMRSQPHMYFSPQLPLAVRVVELHSYTPGDGLMVDGHRDQGSILTMSVLLSDASDFTGGTFTTAGRGDDGGDESDGGDGGGGGSTHVPHHVEKGGAILFHSEKMHNVAPVTRGVRHSLVIELWLGPPNKRDRHS